MARFVREHWQAIVMACLITGFVALVAGTLIEIFDDPRSRTSKIIDQFQTYLGGALALFAAILTAGVLYFSASMPLRAENFRLAQQRRDAEIMGAVVFSSVVSDVLAQLEKAAENLEFYNFADTIEIPALHSQEILATQRHAVTKEIASFWRKISEFNVDVASPAGPFKNEDKLLDAALTNISNARALRALLLRMADEE